MVEGDSNVELIWSKMDNVNGKVSYCITKVGISTINSNEGILFSVIFNKRQDGNYSFSLDNKSLLSDKDGNEIAKVEKITPPVVHNGGSGDNGSVPAVSVATIVNNINAAVIGSTVKCDLTTNPVVSKDIFNAIKGQDKNITFEKNGISWTFNGKDITSNIPSDIDLALKTVSDALKIKEVEKVKKMTGKDELLIPFSFNYDGNLPGIAKVKIYISNSWAGKSVAICRYFEEINNYETIATNTVDADGYITIKINHCSDYFVTQATNLPRTDFNAMANGTVLIGTKAFSLDYANNPLHLEEITSEIVAGGAIYVKDFTGNWIDNLTGLNAMPK